MSNFRCWKSQDTQVDSLSSYLPVTSILLFGVCSVNEPTSPIGLFTWDVLFFRFSMSTEKHVHLNFHSFPTLLPILQDIPILTEIPFA